MPTTPRPDPFQVFDAHVHVGRWRTPDFAGRGSDLADVTRVLASAGVTGALVMATDEGDNAGVLAAVRASDAPVALRFAAWVDPDDLDLPSFLGEHADHVAALKIHPSFARKPVTAPEYRLFLEWASRRGIPVVVHCGRWREVAGWERALEAAETFPSVPFVLSHMGGDGPTLVAGVCDAIRDRALGNVYLGTESIREYWVVARAVDALGPERLLFGSDHNLNHPASFLAVIDALGLDPASRALVVGGNARRLLHG